MVGCGDDDRLLQWRWRDVAQDTGGPDVQLLQAAERAGGLCKPRLEGACALTSVIVGRVDRGDGVVDDGGTG
jgi:hypothetical protein